MRRAHRTTAVGAVLMAAAVAVAGCGGDSSGEVDTPSVDDEISGSIQYAWWGGPARNERTEAVIDLYEAAHPDVTVDGTTAEFGSYWENMTVQAAGSNLPCVPQLQNRTMADYADRGALRPLDDLVESGLIDVSDLPESVLDSGRGSDGNLYMIPYGAAFGSLMVNVTQAEDLGLELPPDGYDWDWLQAWLIDAAEASGRPSLGNVGNQQDLLEAWLRSHGQDFYADGQIGFTPEGIQEYWEYTRALEEAGVTDSPEESVEDRGKPVEQNDFSQGQRVALVWPANALGTIQETMDAVAPGTELAVYPLPTGPEGLGNAFWLSGLSIADNCDNVAAAASFIDFFANDEAAAIAFRADNGATTNTANLEALLADDEIADVKKAELELYSLLAEEGVAPTVYGKGYAAIFQQDFTRFYDQWAFGDSTLEDAAAQFHAEAEANVG